MNTKLTTTNGSRRQSARGFTLIEMIGVLAVIAILAALLVPKVFSAISDARVNNAAVNCETVKTAIADHYGKYGSLLVDGTKTPPVTLSPEQQAQYDRLLLQEGLLDKPFGVKIGDGTTNTLVQAIDISTWATNNAAVSSSMGYALDGATKNTVQGTTLIQAVISGVTPADAQALSQRIDGTSAGMSATSPSTTSDLGGRVKYDAADANGNVTVYVYLTHR